MKYNTKNRKKRGGIIVIVSRGKKKKKRKIGTDESEAKREKNKNDEENRRKYCRNVFLADTSCRVIFSKNASCVANVELIVSQIVLCLQFSAKEWIQG